MARSGAHFMASAVANEIASGVAPTASRSQLLDPQHESDSARHGSRRCCSSDDHTACAMAMITPSGWHGR